VGRVLVVDDEADVRMVVRVLLGRAGHTVIEAGDGAQALDTIRDAGGDLDVVLLDIMMPRMTGPEAFPLIRDIAPDLPVVFVSGYDRGEVAHLLDGGSSGWTAFLAKPFAKEELFDTVEAAVEERR
jgi:two-component system cell cycle sensor histidine kinase/response regulator CckA